MNPWILQVCNPHTAVLIGQDPKNQREAARQEQGSGIPRWVKSSLSLPSFRELSELLLTGHKVGGKADWFFPLLKNPSVWTAGVWWSFTKANPHGTLHSSGTGWAPCHRRDRDSSHFHLQNSWNTSWLLKGSFSVLLVIKRMGRTFYFL